MHLWSQGTLGSPNSPKGLSLPNFLWNIARAEVVIPWGICVCTNPRHQKYMSLFLVTLSLSLKFL